MGAEDRKRSPRHISSDRGKSIYHPRETSSPEGTFVSQSLTVWKTERPSSIATPRGNSSQPTGLSWLKATLQRVTANTGPREPYYLPQHQAFICQIGFKEPYAHHTTDGHKVIPRHVKAGRFDCDFGTLLYPSAGSEDRRNSEVIRRHRSLLGNIH